ncbi:MAG: hypothetical protein JF571_01455, partial [Asticcacaulis sp.]|nr:hypothetical protein [Asticcacaulis sp.]
MSRARKPSMDAKAPAAGGATPRAVSFRGALSATAAFMAVASFGITGLAAGDPLNLNIASRADIDIRIGRNDQSGRIEIYGAIGSRASVRKEDGKVIIRLPGQQKPDLGDLRSHPPIGISAADIRTDPRATELVLTVQQGYDTHFGRADGAVFVQIDPHDHPATTTAPKPDQPITVNLQQLLAGKAADAKAPAAAVAPRLPVVALDVEDNGDGKDIAFPFEGPVASAVFRRGDAIWIV